MISISRSNFLRRSNKRFREEDRVPRATRAHAASKWLEQPLIVAHDDESREWGEGETKTTAKKGLLTDAGICAESASGQVVKLIPSYLQSVCFVHYA